MNTHFLGNKVMSESPSDKKSYKRIIVVVSLTLFVLFVGLYYGRDEKRRVYGGNPHEIVFYDLLSVNYTGKRIVDCGCGDGGLVNWFIEEKRHLDDGGEIYGIDLFEVIVDTKERHPKLSSKHFKEGVGEKMPFDDLSIDVLIFRYSFHHVEDHEKTLKEIIRVLKPGGKVLFVEPMLLRGKYEAYEIAKFLFKEESKEQALAYEYIKKSSPKDGFFMVFEKEFSLYTSLEDLEKASQYLEPDTYSIGKPKAREYAKKIAEEDNVKIEEIKFYGTARLNVWIRSTIIREE